MPALPKVTDSNIVAVVAAMREIMETREFRRGSFLDKALTVRDLVDAGAIKVKSTLDGSAQDAGSTVTTQSTTTIQVVTSSPSTTTPPAPTGVTATAAMQNIIIDWTEPAFADPVFAYAEVWRADSDNQGAAVRIGTTEASVYADPVGIVNTAKYYWVRYVSTADIAGPFNAVAGTSATTSWVNATHIEDLAVTNAKIANLAVDAAKIANLTIVDGKIANATITSAKIVSLVASKISAGTISAALVMANEMALGSGASWGIVRGGQTWYRTGTGFWIGYNPSQAPYMSIGTPGAQELYWDGGTGTLHVQGDVYLKNYLAGNITFVSSDGQKDYAVNYANVEVKSIRITRYGTLRVYFEIMVDGLDGTCTMSIRRDATPVWSTAYDFNNECIGHCTGVWYAKTVDIAVNAGEEIQLWMQQTYNQGNAAAFHIRNYRLQTSFYQNDQVVLA